jgi:hypothetical protein
VQYAAGLELLDEYNDFVSDISEWLVPSGSSVALGSYQTIHRTCRLTLSKELDWGKARVRPYMTLTSISGTFRANLGVFVLSTPTTTAGETPRTWEVEGYDLLELLNHPYGDTYALVAGAGYLTSVNTLITGNPLVIGYLTSQISTSGEPTLPTSRMWPLDPETTTLNIVNDLLTAAGYQAVYASADGAMQSSPYQAPADRAIEWTYSADDARTIVGPMRTLQADFFEAPNHWKFIRDDPEGGAVSEGAGIYTVSNQSDGVTSIDARGRTITRVERLDAATQAALVAQGDRIVATDKRVAIELPSLSVAPNPLHGHFDVVWITDADLGIDQKFVVRSWTLPLDSSDMNLDLRAV